mgnify:CR=1 FL=1
MGNAGDTMGFLDSFTPDGVVGPRGQCAQAGGDDGEHAPDDSGRPVFEAAPAGFRARSDVFDAGADVDLKLLARG